MDVSFKNMSNKTISIQVDPNDKLESVIPKLMEQNEIDPEKNTIKFIFKGRVLMKSPTISYIPGKLIDLPDVITPITTSDF